MSGDYFEPEGGNQKAAVRKAVIALFETSYMKGGKK